MVSNQNLWFSIGASQVVLVLKNPPDNAGATLEMQVQSLGPEDPLEKGMAVHSSILAWRLSWTEEFDGLQFIGLQRAGHDQNDWACMHAWFGIKQSPTDSVALF